MDINEIAQLITNNGVSIAIIAYFCIRDWKFYDTLQKTLTSLESSIETMKQIVNQNKE